jgi:hypothetical protein
MPAGIWNRQWLNQNGGRAYPLTDWATKRDQTDTIEIPDSFIVAMQFPVHAGMDVEPQRFFIKTLGVFPTGFNIGIGYDDDSSEPPLVGAVNVPFSTHTENRVYAIAGVDDFSDSVGHIAIGTLDEAGLLTPGEYHFDRDGSAIETDAIRPMIRGISSITVVNAANQRSEKLYGDIELIAGTNMRLTVATGAGDPQITFSAISGEGLNEECLCEEEAEGQCIRTINGIPPLPDGNFRFIGDDCIVIEPIDNGLQFIDQCSSPCCGCPELDAMRQQIDRFADGARTLTNFVDRLSVEVTEMSATILSSKLSDQGCLEC